MGNQTGFELVSSDFEENLREQSFAVEQMLLGSGSNLGTRYFKNLESKKNGTRLKL